MARKLKPSPLPGRIEPERPLQNWLWADKGLYDGVWVPASAAASDHLAPYLAHHKTLLRVDDGLCLIFQTPVELTPAELGLALPLKAMGRNNFCSFDLASVQKGAADANMLHLVRSGARLSSDLTQAITVNPLDFWDISKLTTVGSTPLPTRIGAAAPRPVQHPKRSKALASIAKSKPIFADVHADIDTIPDRNISDTARKVGRFLRSILATITLVFLTIIGILLLLALIGMGARGGLVGVIFAAALVYWIASAFVGPRVFGGADNKGDTGNAKARGTTVPKNKGPGLLDHLKSWALWNTGLGNRLRADLERHINDVSRMIDRGEIDKALKRAIALGAKEEAAKKRKSAPMTSLPKPRGSLDLDVSGIDPPSASVLSEFGYGEMHTQYVKLAQKISAEGDHRRAAFIYAELIKDVDKALIELEALKAYEDAAKLATARKSPGHVAARLWFLAGKKDIALALAKQFDAMEYIANTAEKKDPDFAAFVRGHWIEELIGAGDLARAVIQSAGRPQLRKLHTAVLKQALLAGLLDDNAVLAAAVVTLDWRIAALDQSYLPSGTNYRSLLETHLHRLIHGGNAADADQRQTLLTALSDQYNDQDAFWKDRAPPLVDCLIRATLVNDVGHPSALSIATLTRCAQKIGTPAMAEDLRHIKRGKPASPVTEHSIRVPLAPDINAQWSMLACAVKGRTLVGASDGELTLIDKGGNRLWTDHMTDLVGIVTIGPGRLMILVQGRSTERTLTVLDTLLHSYRRLGQLQLLTWHTLASATSWMIQSPEAVGTLDVSALLNPMPSFDLLWSITQTTPLVVLGFQASQTPIRWITQRTNAGKPGLIEIWELKQRQQELSVKLLNPVSDDTRDMYRVPYLWMPQNTFARLNCDPTTPDRLLHIKPITQIYSYEGEEGILSANADFFAELERFAAVTTLDEGQPHAVQVPDADKARVTLSLVDGRRQVSLQGARIVAQAGSVEGQRLALIDDAKRVISCDFRPQAAL